jgi:hypothetical protein
MRIFLYKWLWSPEAAEKENRKNLENPALQKREAIYSVIGGISSVIGCIFLFLYAIFS